MLASLQFRSLLLEAYCVQGSRFKISLISEMLIEYLLRAKWVCHAVFSLTGSCCISLMFEETVRTPSL